MNLLLVHIGSDIPQHVFDGLENKLQHFKGNISIIVDPPNINKFVPKGFPIQVLSSVIFEDHLMVQRFKQSNFLEAGFWTNTALRLFLIEAFMESEYNRGDRKVIHTENDVLIYSNPEVLAEKFASLYKDKVVVNPIGEDYLTFAYAYIDTLEAIHRVNEKFLELIVKSHAELNELTRNAGLNEMTIMNVVYRQNPELFDFLPILPTGEFSKYKEELGYLFDCASWGQYLGGTPGGNNEGWTGNHHYIGREIIAGKSTPFEILDYPILQNKLYGVKDLVNNKIYSLHCLHVHSKDLRRFM